VKRILLVGATVLAAVATTVVLATPSSAATALVTVTATSPETGSEAFKGANAICPSGTQLVGGGAAINGGGHSVQIVGLNPAPAGLPANSFWATAVESVFGYDPNWSITAWATCSSTVTGVQIVQASSDASAGATIATATAVCPAGKKVIGAGGVTAGKPNYILDTMDIASDLSSVYVETTAASADPATAPLAIAYAICIDPVPGQQRVAAMGTYDSSDKTLGAKCPSGTKVFGVGGGMTGALGQAQLTALYPYHTTNRLGQTFYSAVLKAVEDADGDAGTWRVDTYAVCAS
jgi:hypothetical protein